MTLINNGIDPHSYLGSQLAYNLDQQFREYCDAETNGSPLKVFEAFESFKTSEDPDLKEFHKHYRTFAKPTGLGYPGGLGAETFITYAKGTYGVVVDLATATRLREIWHATFPEMKPYFDWINSFLQDTRIPESYAYRSPLGMLRSGTSYCAAANGYGLQTPSAEGNKLAAQAIGQACSDPTLESCLYGCHPVAFIHDEFLLEIPDDEFSHERSLEVCRIMVEAFQPICPDVKIKASPALMRRWDKRAEAVYVDGRLSVWEPPTS